MDSFRNGARFRVSYPIFLSKDERLTLVFFLHKFAVNAKFVSRDRGVGSGSKLSLSLSLSPPQIKRDARFFCQKRRSSSPNLVSPEAAPKISARSAAEMTKGAENLDMKPIHSTTFDEKISLFI